MVTGAPPRKMLRKMNRQRIHSMRHGGGVIRCGILAVEATRHQHRRTDACLPHRYAAALRWA